MDEMDYVYAGTVRTRWIDLGLEEYSGDVGQAPGGSQSDEEMRGRNHNRFL